jgi:hypothetical protein
MNDNFVLFLCVFLWLMIIIAVVRIIFWNLGCYCSFAINNTTIPVDREGEIDIPPVVFCVTGELENENSILNSISIEPHKNNIICNNVPIVNATVCNSEPITFANIV